MGDGVPTALEWLLAMGDNGVFNHALPRLQRYDLNLALRYRAKGETTWYEGRTENISDTGVYLRGNCLMAVDSEVEISFEAIRGTDGEALAEIKCQGQIVRVVLPLALDSHPGLAVRIAQYSFVQAKTGWVA